jgi:hypothetical protein
MYYLSKFSKDRTKTKKDIPILCMNIYEKILNKILTNRIQCLNNNKIY